MSSNHGREVGVKFYNELCEKLGIPEDKWIDSELTEQQIEELDELNLTDNEKALKIEESDSTREIIIQGFQKKIFTFSEEGNIIQKLISPIKDKSGKVLHSVLEWNEDYDYLTFENNAKNINPELNQIGMLRAMIASRTGVNRVMIGRMRSKDISYAQALNGFFQTADSRI